MVALFFYAKKGGFSMKNQSYLSVYKCNEFRVVSNEFIGRIEDTPENISAFVVSADFNSNYAFVEDKKKRYKSLVSWEDEQPFDIYEFLLTQDIEM